MNHTLHVRFSHTPKVLDHSSYLDYGTVTSLRIIHTEGQPAQCVLSTSSPPYLQRHRHQRQQDKHDDENNHHNKNNDQLGKDAHDPPPAYVSIWYGAVPLDATADMVFWGRLIQRQNHGHSTQWVFEAKDPQQSVQLEDILSLSGSKDPLYRPTWEVDLEEILSTNPYALYWNRCDGMVGLSHWMRGSTTWSVGGQCDPSFTTMGSIPPVSTVKVHVSFQWTQHLLTFRDIADDILKHWDHQGLGPAHTIGTLTHQSLENAWPETGKIIGPGCFVAHSQLTPHRATACPHWVHLTGPHQSKVMVAQCVFYDVSLVVGIMHRYRRAENVTYVLRHALHSHGTTDTLHVTLPPHWSRHESIPLWHPLATYQPQDIVQHEGKVYRYVPDDEGQEVSQRTSLQRFAQEPLAHQGHWVIDPQETAYVLPMFCDSLMDQDMGKALLNHSLHKAKVLVCKGMRCQWIQLRGTIHDWHAMTVDDEVEWRPTPDAPQVKAKITSYELVYDALRRYGHVTLKAAYAVDDSSSSHAKQLGWASRWEDYEYREAEETPKPHPLPPVSPPDIHVTNTLAEQMQWVADANEHPQSHDASMKSKETSIRIRMRPPPSNPILERCVELASSAVFHPDFAP